MQQAGAGRVPIHKDVRWEYGAQRTQQEHAKLALHFPTAKAAALTSLTRDPKGEVLMDRSSTSICSVALGGISPMPLGPYACG